MLRSLLGTFGIEPRAEPDLDSLVEGLRFRHALLILDNCEHLLDAVAATTRLIVSSCPGVQMLATSREPLDVDGERTRRTSSLNLDDDGPAVALFRLRAEEAGAVLDPTRDTAAIVRICRRLDGIPLAIELAAARARSLRPAEIADRLDDMFRLLTGGRRGSVERHRTLRAALDWSHDLLPEPQQVLLARLSIFAGSFPLDAAEAVGGGDPVDGEEVVDLIDRLVARSLVVPVGEGDESRFRLLEPVRQLAAEKLAARGETEAARDAHTQWYLDLIVGLGERWRAGDDQGTWPIAARELPNLRAAFDHLVETGRVDDAQRFAVAGYGPIALHFDTVPLYDWAPRAASLDPSTSVPRRRQCVPWPPGARFPAATSTARPPGCAAARRPSNTAPATTASSWPRRCTTWCSVVISPWTTSSFSAAWTTPCAATNSIGRSGCSRTPGEPTRPSPWRGPSATSC